MSSKNRKRLLLVASLFLFMLIAAGCSTSPVDSSSTGFWDHYVIYNFSRFILWLADIFGGSYGWAIVAFTIIIRVIILPLTWWQSKSMLKQQEVAPEIQALQKKYASKDAETQQKLREETQKLYAEAGRQSSCGLFTTSGSNASVDCLVPSNLSNSCFKELGRSYGCNLGKLILTLLWLSWLRSLHLQHRI